MLTTVNLDTEQVADRLRVSDAPGTKRRHLADLSRPVRIVEAGLLLGDLEVVFRDQTLDAVIVVAPDSRGAGLLNRRRYNTALTGRLGYGRAVHIRRPIGEIADWEPLVLAPQTSVADAAARAMARGGQRRYDQILVADKQWSVADFGDVVDALIAALSARSHQDQLTGIPTRGAALEELQRRCDRARRGKARIALILIKINGLRHINAAHGQRGGDAIIQAVSRQLLAHRLPGQEIARVSGATFAITVTLPETDELRIAATVEHISRQFLATLSAAPKDIPAHVWPTFLAGTAWNDHRTRDADGLMQVAFDRLRSTIPLR